VRFPNRVTEPRFEGQFGFVGDFNKKEKYLLLSSFDGDLKQAIVELINLQSFDVMHRWNPDIDSFFEKVDKVEGGEWENLMRDRNDGRSRFIHPLLEEDGSLLFQNGTPLIKIDENSELEWMKDDEVYHHSIEEDSDGNFWICVSYFPYKIDSMYVGKEFGNYLDDGIRKLSPNGDILFDKSVSELFIENDMEYLLFSVGDMEFTVDPIHLNDIEPVEKNTEHWKKGDVFLSLRHQSMILLYRPETNEIIWKSSGAFYHQHDVDILDDSRISIFNNNSKEIFSGSSIDGYNQVVIYNFETDKYSHYLDEPLKKEEVRSRTAGRSQILPNGDLFIEETNYGRTLYFNSDGSLRWTHINRANDGHIYTVGWSRILYSEHDIGKIHRFLKNKNEVTYNE